MNMRRIKILLIRWFQGLGFAAFLTVLLIGAKLTNHLAWSWGWAVSPIWLSLIFTLTPIVLGLFGMGFISLLAWMFGQDKGKPHDHNH